MKWKRRASTGATCTVFRITRDSTSIFMRRWENYNEPIRGNAKHDVRTGGVGKETSLADCSIGWIVAMAFVGAFMAYGFDYYTTELEGPALFAETCAVAPKRADRRQSGRVWRAHVFRDFSLSSSQTLGLARQAGKFTPLAGFPRHHGHRRAARDRTALFI